MVLLFSLRLWAETQLPAQHGRLLFSPYAALPRPKPWPSCPNQGPLSSDESATAPLLATCRRPLPITPTPSPPHTSLHQAGPHALVVVASDSAPVWDLED
jgi:hypothetical protein